MVRRVVLELYAGWLTLVSSPLLALPSELISEIFRILVLTWIPALRNSFCRRNRGWLCLLWVCCHTRAVLLDDRIAWALAYCHLPSQLDLMKRAAGGCLISYVLTPSIPAMHQSLVTDNAIIDRIRRDTRFETCSRIVVDRRGDIYDHIQSLVKLSKPGVSLDNVRELCLTALFAYDNKLVQLTKYVQRCDSRI